MTLTADKKGRIGSRDLFKPLASFEAQKQEDGSVLIREVISVEEECEVLGLEDVDPKTLLPKDGSKIVPESIVAAIRADREGRI